MYPTTVHKNEIDIPTSIIQVPYPIGKGTRNSQILLFLPFLRQYTSVESRNRFSASAPVKPSKSLSCFNIHTRPQPNYTKLRRLPGKHANVKFTVLHCAHRCVTGHARLRSLKGGPGPYTEYTPKTDHARLCGAVPSLLTG